MAERSEKGSSPQRKNLAQDNIFYFGKPNRLREVVHLSLRSTRSELTGWRTLWVLSVRRQKDKGRAIRAEATRSKMTNLKKMYISLHSLEKVYLFYMAIFPWGWDLSRLFLMWSSAFSFCCPQKNRIYEWLWRKNCLLISIQDIHEVGDM